MALTLEEDMRGLLAAAGVGSITPNIEWSLNLSRMPASPNRQFSIVRTGGKPSDPKWALDYPSMQVMVRGNPGDFIIARDKAQNAKDALLGLTSQTIGDTRWVSVTAIGDVNYLGYDENERPMLSVNFALIIEPPPGANREAL